MFNRIEVGFVAMFAEFDLAPARPFANVGHEKYLEIGIGKDDRPDVATFQNNTAVLTKVTLFAHHDLSDSRETTYFTHRLRHFRLADLFGYVDVVKKDNESTIAKSESNAGATGQIRNSDSIRRIDSLAEYLPRHRPVHCTGVDVKILQSLSRQSCGGAFPGSGGTIDCNDEFPQSLNSAGKLGFKYTNFLSPNQPFGLDFLLLAECRIARKWSELIIFGTCAN
jgi:hypothetical protein